jgi:hypothetical protein
MMKWMLAAGAAALAIASPVSADRGGHGGKGQGGQQAQNDRGGGGGQKQAKSNRGGGDRQVRMNSGGGGGGNREFRATKNERGDGGNGRQMRFVQQDSNRGHSRGNDRVRIENRQGDNHQGRQARFENGQGDNHQGNGRVRFENRGDNGVRVARVDNDRRHGRDFVDVTGNKVFKVRDVDRGVVRIRDVDRDELFGRRLGYGVGGCPPGLAKKGNGCMPPGQAAKYIGQPLLAATRFGALEPLPRSFDSLFYDNDDYYYRYGGGYLYRVDRNRDLIDGLIPLFGAALIGQPLGANYINPYYQPSYYSAFYPNSPYDCHQYGYGYVYETDCMTGMVEDVIPTYDYGYGIGQIMPASYSYYNVPYAYRSYYVDNDDYYYRYAPGAIYRVDRDTALISAVAALLTGGLSVGQQLPVGYSAYNVPLAYRSSYYDTPDVWYRYDNGYIYGINPQTRVVSNVAYVIV